MDEQTIEALASGEPDPHTTFDVEILKESVSALLTPDTKFYV